MTGRIWNRLGRAGLAFAVALATLGTLGTAPAYADTLIGTKVFGHYAGEGNTTQTQWVPFATDPAGIEYMGATPSPHLLVVDTNTGLGVNAWDYTVATATPVLNTALNIDEITGIEYDAGNNRLFVTSDGPNRIIIINDYPSGNRQIMDVAAVSGDTEDPAYDPATNELYFLDGHNELIQKVSINPATGAGTLVPGFFIDLSGLSPEGPGLGDWEAMSWNPERQTLVVAPNDDSLVVYEIPTTAGSRPTVANNIIIGSGVEGMTSISGLDLAPASNGGGQLNYYVADRNSVSIFEFSTGDVGPTAPVAHATSATVPFNTPTPIMMVATDANNDPVTYTVVSGPSMGTLNPTGGPGSATRTYTPPAGFSGPVTFTFNATAGGDTSNTATFTINVSPQNNPPVLIAIPTPKVVNELVAMTFKAFATDPNGGALTFSLQNAPSGASINPTTGVFSWKPSEAQGPGTYNVTVRVTDSGGLFDTQVVQIQVKEVGGGGGGGGTPDNPFIDDDGNIFEDAIEWMRAEGITLGCNPPTNNRFCPNDRVTRGQMAAFLVRALGYTAGGNTNYFVDDNGNIFETSINRLRAAEVTLGCNPPSNNRYCPNDFVTRGQMAAFLVRALGYTAGGNTNYFIDDNGSVFETQINRLREAGVTLGCNPPANNRYCPTDFVTRGQMAAFLKRALDT